MRWLSLFGLLFLCPSNGAFAQQPHDICTGVLTYTGRDTVSEERENAIAADLFNEHCEGQSVSSSRSTEVGLEAVVKSIPVKFSFGGTTAKDKLSQFCKTYNSSRTEYAAQKRDTSTVVREALRAFNECVASAAKGIYFNPKIQSTQLAVDIKRGSGDPEVRGVKYDSKLLSCEFAVGDSTAVANATSRRKIGPDTLTIACNRKPQAQPDGGVVYPSAEILIVTSETSMALRVPEDGVWPSKWASDVADSLKKMSAEIERLAKPVEIECERKTNMGAMATVDALATADMPLGWWKEGWVVTGGGCEQIGPNRHAMVFSGPVPPSGWKCTNTRIGDGSPTLQLKATVVFCRIKPRL